MIEAYLSDDLVGSGVETFERQFEEHFNKDSHVSHLSPNFFMMFLLGFHDGLLTNQVRSRYGIEHIFHGWYGEFNLVKAFILTNLNGKKKMIIRNFYLSGRENGISTPPKYNSEDVPRLLTENEKVRMENELTRWRYALKNYNDDDRSNGMSFEEYKRERILSLDETELNSRLESQRISEGNLDMFKEYFFDAKEFTIQEIEYEGAETTRKSHIQLTRIFGLQPNAKNRNQIFYHSILPKLTQFSLNSNVVSRAENLLLLTDDIDFYETDQNLGQPTLLNIFKELFTENMIQDEQEHSFAVLVEKIDNLYNLQTIKLHFAENSKAAQCAFTFGTLAAIRLTHAPSKLAEIKIVQSINEGAQQQEVALVAQDGVIDDDVIPVEDDFFLLMEPGKNLDINKMAGKLPVIFEFTDHLERSSILSMGKFRNTAASKLLIIHAEFHRNNAASIVTIRLPNQNHLIKDLIHQSGIQNLLEEPNRNRFKNYLVELFNSIKPSNLEQEPIDVASLSRHIFGSLISSLGREDGFNVYEMRSKGGNVPSKTTFLIRSNIRDSKNELHERNLIFKFDEHLDTKDIFNDMSEPTENFDTLVAHISQNIESSPINPLSGYTKRSLNIHQAQFASFKDKYTLSKIDHLPLSLLKTNEPQITEFHTSLEQILKKFPHLIEEPSVINSANFKAIIGGLFHNEPSIENAIELPKYLSTAQYTLLIPRKISEKTNAAGTSQDGESEMDDHKEMSSQGSNSDDEITSDFNSDMMSLESDLHEESNMNVDEISHGSDSYEGSINDMSEDGISYESDSHEENIDEMDFDIGNYRSIASPENVIDDDPQKLLTVNFKHFKEEPNEISLPLKGVTEMMHLIQKSQGYETGDIVNQENDIANLYFVDDFQKPSNSERRLATTADYLRACRGSRQKRNTADICKQTNDEEEKRVESEELHISPEKKIILKDLSAISNHAMMGFMVRDLISDIYHGNKVGILKDSSFLIAALFSQEIADFLSEKASIMIANEFKVAGYLTKSLAYGVSRAISFYVLYDFIENTIKYVGNNSDESAKRAMGVDGAFLVIDLIVDTISVLEFFGFIAGVSAVAGPIGGIIAVGLVLALNLYNVHERIENIEKVVHLSWNDRMEEGLRGLLYMDPALNVKELMNEATANEQLKKGAMSFLTKQSTYNVFFTKSATIVNGALNMEPDATINVQNKEQFFMSRASPKSTENYDIICKLREESKELHKWKFWSDGIIQLMDVLGVYRQVEKADHIMHRGYACRHSFGIKLLSSAQTLAAYFDMGDGDDDVKGFVNASNSFHLGQGRKSIIGGDKNDVFSLYNLNLTGVLDGASGMDILDISAAKWDQNFFLFDEEFSSKRFELKNIEVILGRAGITDKIFCLCTFRMLRLYGGSQSAADNIKVADKDCVYDLIIYLDGQTEVQNSANTGHFVYVAYLTQTSNFYIGLDANYSNESTAVHDFVMNHPFTSLAATLNNHGQSIEVKSIEFSKMMGNLTIIMQQNQTTPINIHFTDDCRITIFGEEMHFILNSTLPTKAILRTYAKKVRSIGIPLMSAYSAANDEMITMTNRKSTVRPSVIFTSPNYKTKIFIENCGRHLILINATSWANYVNFQKVEVQAQDCSCSSLVIDFNLVIEKLGMLNVTEDLEIIATKSDYTLHLYTVTRNKSIEKFLGGIYILGAFKDKCYNNIIVRSYTDHRIINDQKPIGISRSSKFIRLFTRDDYLVRQAARYAKSLLKPVPLVFNSKYKFVYLSNINTEWFSKVQINATLGAMEFYRMGNKSLVLTNVRTLGNEDSTNLCSIYLENFYESKKLSTLTIRASLFRINLIFELEKTKTAPHIGDLLKLLKVE